MSDISPRLRRRAGHLDVVGGQGDHHRRVQEQGEKAEEPEGGGGGQ